MPRSWTKTEAFEHFGADLENARWSWSAVSRDGSAVVVVLWQDGIKGRDGKLTYADDEDIDAEWRQRIGAKRRIEHLKFSMESLSGKFRAVIAKARDTTASPREIEKSFPQENAYWQLDSFDESTGAFTAHVVRE